MLLSVGALSGCASDGEVPPRTRKECRDDPSLVGCANGLPVEGAEGRRAGDARESTPGARRGERRSTRHASGGWGRKSDPSVCQDIDDFIVAHAAGCDPSPATAEADVAFDEHLDTTQGPPSAANGRWCRDVTTFDYNWDNDMLCQGPDGEPFYTSYEGADAFLAGN